jgi:hypothetical protein
MTTSGPLDGFVRFQGAFMISLVSAHRPNRGVSRRAWLRLSSLGLLGLSLPHRLAGAHATGAAKRCIFIFLCGGPSQNDLWDLKPEAPDGIRSVFRPIHTNVSGIQFGELIPQVARHADKLAIIRSMTHDDNGHGTAIARSVLGQLPAQPGAEHVSRQDHPGLGGILHRLEGACGELPPWVILPRPFTTGGPPYKGQSAGFLGAAFDPLMFDKDKKGSLSDRPVKLDAIRLPDGIDSARFDSRRRMLGEFSETIDRGRSVAESLLAANYEQALNLMSSSSANRAFDLNHEPAALRDRYGRNEYGQSFLLARRLVEAGVRVVNVFWTFFDEKGCQFNLWDNHGVPSDICGIDGQFTGEAMLKHQYCCPSFDRSFSALLEDLQQRGLLEETLVAVAGEFGRTPRINATAGRDHWAPCYTQLLAGGGIRGGRVYGASDRIGAYVKDLPVTPDDYMATILHAFGHAPETEIFDPLNRPHRVSLGVPVTALF